MSEKILVCIRVRPLNNKEKVRVWKTTQQCKTIYYDKNGVTDYAYTFDHIFEENVSTRTIYDTVAKSIITSAINGFNGTIFAYGQTSSGKTYTMTGTPKELGIIPIAIDDIFNMIQKNDNREFLVRVSYIEIYKEIIIDLLNPSAQNLKIHESLEKGIYVADVKEVVVDSCKQVLQLMKQGEQNRHTSSTGVHDRSSRSHTIFRITIESRERNDETGGVRVSNLNLVDLAGSERVCDTLAEGERLVEGSHINKSLLTLGVVIQKLAEYGDSVYIPYRDSKLTRILQPALGGNSKTAIICTITPDEKFADLTHSTLKFANRAKNITCNAHINEILQQEERNKWKAMYNEMKKKWEEERTKNQELQDQISNMKIIQQDHDVLKQRIKSRDEEILSLKKENEELLHKIRELEEEKCELMSQNRSFEKENRYVQMIKKLRNEKKLLESKVKKLKSELREKNSKTIERKVLNTLNPNFDKENVQQTCKE